MASEKKEKLEMALIGIQRRWGSHAIGLVKRRSATIPHISTGFPALDEALGIGGIPRGRISEIIGVPTSGMASLALKIMSNTGKGSAVYVDLEQTFDADYAERCGVGLHRLVLVHPTNIHQALAMLPDLVINGGVELIVFDMPLHLQIELQALSRSLGRLLSPLSRTDCTLLFLTTLLPGSSPSLAPYPQHATLPYYATVRLLIQKERWLYSQQDVSGYEAQVLVAKNKLGMAGKKAKITITFDSWRS